jgi:hypothetical protein
MIFRLFGVFLLGMAGLLLLVFMPGRAGSHLLAKRGKYFETGIVLVVVSLIGLGVVLIMFGAPGQSILAAR